MTAVALVAGAVAAAALGVGVRPGLRSGRGRRAPAAAPVPAGNSPLGRAAVAAGGASVFGLLAAGPSGALLGAGVGVGVALAVRRRQATRRAETARGATIEFCRGVATELRAGRPPTEAFAAAAASAPSGLRDRLAPAAEAAASSGDPAAVARLLDDAAGGALAGLRRFAACWRVAAATGARLAPAADRVADALHDDVELDRAVATAMAGVRATIRLLAALPLAGLLLGTGLGARPIAFLTASPAGWACGAMAIALDGVGVLWAGRIARRAGAAIR
jgi:tight adherence protein B